MIALPTVKGATHPAREPHLRGQQQHRSAIVGSCAVLTKEAGPIVFQNRRRASSSRVPEHASQNVVATTPAAVDQQNVIRGCGPVHAHNEVQDPAKTVRWSHLHSKLLATLKQTPGLLPRGSRVLVAVSGGQDSMALLRLLVDLQRHSSKHKTAPWPLQLVVGHCDHNIREDSAQNADFVHAQAVIMDTWLRRWQEASGVVRDTAPSVLQQSQRLSSPDSYMELGQQLLQETLLQPQQQAGVQSAAAFQPSANCHNSQAHIVAAATAADVARQPTRPSDKDQRRTRLQQNQDSAMMEDFVHQHAHQLGLRYRSRTAEQQLKSEAAARSWRHKMLAEMAIESGCSHVVLGHTATDRAETLMFNLVRGSGPSGLCSMGWGRPMTDNSRLQLVRPLLNFTREETAEVCRVTGTQVYEDSTNSDDQYSRNRLRLRVFPHLAAINRLVVQHMAQTCELLQADNYLLDRLARRHMRNVLQDCVLRMVTAEAQQSAQVAGHRGQEGLTALPSGSCTADISGESPATGTNRGLLTEHSTAGIASIALCVGELELMPKALQHRVIHQWLQRHLTGAVSYHMVQEVQDLGVKAAGVGRTGTLRGRQCVVRRKGLLLCVDNTTADQLVAGKVRVTQAQEQPEVKQVQQLKLQPECGANVSVLAETAINIITTTTTTTSSSSSKTAGRMRPRGSRSWQLPHDRPKAPVSEVAVTAGADSNFLPKAPGRRRRKATESCSSESVVSVIG